MKKRSLKAFDKQSINGLEERLRYRILDLEAALTVQKKNCRNSTKQKYGKSKYHKII